MRDSFRLGLRPTERQPSCEGTGRSGCAWTCGKPLAQLRGARNLRGGARLCKRLKTGSGHDELRLGLWGRWCSGSARLRSGGGGVRRNVFFRFSSARYDRCRGAAEPKFWASPMAGRAQVWFRRRCFRVALPLVAEARGRSPHRQAPAWLAECRDRSRGGGRRSGRASRDTHWRRRNRRPATARERACHSNASAATSANRLGWVATKRAEPRWRCGVRLPDFANGTDVRVGPGSVSGGAPGTSGSVRSRPVRFGSRTGHGSWRFRQRIDERVRAVERGRALRGVG